ncbi:MAG: sialate O-acetylesterase [Haliscomenobacter sp.]|nr:sialate O-acetylesterase [Haliscomenobacter sp.]
MNFCKKTNELKVAGILLCLSLPLSLAAQWNIAPVFSDYMVLQRDQPISVWGKGVPGEEVAVVFSGKTNRTEVAPDSSWLVVLPPQGVAHAGQPLTISARGFQAAFREVLVGDVWLCFGQSNMQWPMQREMHYVQETEHLDQPLMRFLNPTYAGEQVFGVPFTDSIVRNMTPASFYQGKWERCDTASFRTMSAVGYYFGKAVASEMQIPIGLIDLSIGGAPIEAFIPLSALANHPEYSAKTGQNWLQNPAVPVWVRERGAQNTAGVTGIPQNVHGPNHPFKPGFAYEAGIQPLLRFPIKGLLWYQGESNAQEIERVSEYPALCGLMVSELRRLWKNPALPFYFVQLSSIDTLRYKGQLWPQFRDAQRTMPLLIPHSGMAVCSDAGAPHDVHPTDKKVVGERLARWALAETYAKKIVASGPLPKKAKYKKGEIVVEFFYGKGLHSSDSAPLKGFSLDGETGIFASIRKNKAVIPAFEKPEFLYYGWKPFSDGNVVNREKLPASTFKIKVQ